MARYNEPVQDIFGLDTTDGEIGIEIEMEGRGLIHAPVGKYWVTHPDGSLRGEENVEYVLRHPLDRDAVPVALKILFKELGNIGAKIRKDSPNTSVHVHLNVQKWSIKKVYNLITLWYILEYVLTSWCGEDRVGNLFCLRGSDAEASLMRLASAVRYNRYNTLADQDGLRYSALNYTALSKFGSLEFRSLGGVYNEDVINNWVRILLSLKDFADRYESPPEIISEMSRSGPEEFLKMVLPDLWRIVWTDSVHDQIYRGMRLIQNVAYAVNWTRESVKKKSEPKSQTD